MKKSIYLIVLLLAVSLSANAQNNRQEQKTKKGVSTFLSKVKTIDDAEKKEKVIGKLLLKMNEEYAEMDKTKLSEQQQLEMTTMLNNLNTSFETVKGTDNEQLNQFADYMESEFNQASDAFVLIMGLIFGILPLLFLL